MLSDKKLFEIMIKYHPTFIGWLIENKKVEKLKNKLVLYTQKEDQPQYIRKYNGRVSHINSDGIKSITGHTWDKDFTNITILRGEYSDLVANGYDIFDIPYTTIGKHCLTSQIGKILVHHYDILGDIEFPLNFPRLKGKEALAYIKWMECKHDYLKEHNFHFNLYKVSRSRYIGLSGFSDYQPKIIDNIQKFGIFAYEPIYKEIEWTFDLVEKYKDTVIWGRLMDDSNLIWEEDMLVKYDKYIPYQYIDNYESFGFLSNSFLREHIDMLDWKKVLRDGKFKWNKEDLDYFCKYALCHDKKYMSTEIIDGIPYSRPFPNLPLTPGRPTYDVEAILSNEYFEWDADKLYTYLQLHDDFWNSIKGRKKLHKIFLQIPNVREIARPYIEDDKFWDIVSYDHDFDYDELSKEFTIDNIKRNIENWSIPLNNIISVPLKLGRVEI